MANPEPSTLWTISVPAVRWSIETLGKQKIHSAFMMYLYLRLRARQMLLAESSPSSDELKSFIEMPGNPEKPYYFPMIDRGPRDIGPLPSFWRATNISGLWSAKTLGRSGPLRWLTDGNGHYAMPANNSDLAFKNLLFEERVSAVALGAFFLRDDVFVSDVEPGPSDLVQGFRELFDFPAADGDFNELFRSSVSIVNEGPIPSPWFESAPQSVLERLIG